MEEHGPEATGKPEVVDIELKPYEGAAAGVPSIVQTMKHAFRKAGVFKGTGLLWRVNKQEGFDCPGCAWPDPADRSIAEFCENGAKAVADEAHKERVDEAFFSRWSVSELAEQSDYWINSQGRITRPFVLREGAERYQPIDWDDAFALIGHKLTALDSPDEAIFYTSGRTSNEAAFLYQLFVRQFGTNNLPDCSNMCHESSGRGLGEVIGIGKGTVTLKDFSRSDCIFVIGQNPGTNHPRMLTALQEAARNGARIISVNPLKEASLVRFKHPQEVTRLFGSGTEISSHYLQVKINGDSALLQGIMKALLALEDDSTGRVLDQDFIQEHTAGFESFQEHIRGQSWDEITTQSGISRDQIEKVAEVVADSERMIVCWAMGITQHKNGVATIQDVVNMLLMGGHLGRPGAGACPVRGHSNVQGDRTMGIWERPTDALLDSLAEEFDFEPPREHGHDTVHAIQAMHRGDARIFFAMGGNFLSATPDTDFTAEALRNTDLTVHVSTKLNRAHLVHGKEALILPCVGRTEVHLQAAGEQFVTVENSMGVVHRSRGRLEPISEHLLTEPEIVARLAVATLGENTTVDWMHLIENYDRIRNHIEAVIPGFDDYNRRVREPNGFHLPNSARERQWNTHNGKANFTVHPLPEHDLEPDQLMLMTMRSHDQYNTTIYGLDDRYRGVYNQRRVVFLNEDDMADQELVTGQVVDLVSHFEGQKRVGERFIVVPYEIPRGCAGAYFPEANVLVPVDSVADKSNTPTSKSIVITIEKRFTTDA